MTDKKEMINRPKKKDDHFMDIVKYEAIKLEAETPEIDTQEQDSIYDEIGY